MYELVWGIHEGEDSYYNQSFEPRSDHAVPTAAMYCIWEFR